MGPHDRSRRECRRGDGTGGGSDDRFRTVKLDAATGETLWSQSFEGSPVRNVFNEGFAVVFSPDGSKVFSAGTSGGNIAVTIAYDFQSGEQLWSSNAGEYLGGYPYRIATSHDGALVYIAGSISSQVDDRAYDAASGRPVWVGRQIDLSKTQTEGGGERAYDLTVGPDDRLYVTGKGFSSMFTFAFDGRAI